MDFILKQKSEEQFMLAKILDIAYRNLNDEQREEQVKKKIDEYRKLKLITIEDIFKDLHYKVIVFETCAGKLKFNTLIDTPESKILFFLAYDETTVYEVALKVNEEESSLLDISGYDKSKILEILNFAKLKNDSLQCTFKLGSVVKAPEKKTRLFCGTTSDRKNIVLNEKNEYNLVSEILEPSEDSTTSMELDNIFLELQVIASRQEELPQSYNLQIVNFNQEFVDEQLKELTSS